MSKFVCECNYVISCVEHPCAYESIVLPQVQLERILTDLGSMLGSLAQLRSEDRPSWIASQFGEDYPTDAGDDEIIEDMLTQKLTDVGRFMLTCPSCGRLHVQVSAVEKQYRSYAPVNDAPINDVSRDER